MQSNEAGKSSNKGSKLIMREPRDNEGNYTFNNSVHMKWNNEAN